VGVGISKMIDFVLYFQDNVQNSAKKNFPIYRLIVQRGVDKVNIGGI